MRDESAEYYGHSLPGHSRSRWQPLRTHLTSVAEQARNFARPFKAGDWAYLAGLWHDLGKFTHAFQRRLDGGPRVDHSSAGAQHAVNKLGDVGKVLAYAIAGHHSGLPDGKDAGSGSLGTRLSKALTELPNVPVDLTMADTPGRLPFNVEQSRLGYQASFFIRMVYSCLVDADFLDTEAFLQPHRARLRERRPSFLTLKAALDRHLGGFPTPTPGSVNEVRAKVLSQCRDAAMARPGMFSLTVPTGGGKTLSSLAFALEHALYHDMERVIYVIPYTSIIEQNADVFRKVLGSDAVLEHHSNYEHRSDADDQELDDQDGQAHNYHELRHTLASENWNAPVVVTTNVQFFESLFAARSSRCRKLHNIVNSVVILDEAQTLPVPLLQPCLEALRELTINYHTSVVLCTATQPALSSNETFRVGLNDVHEIMRCPAELQRATRRVQLEMLDEELEDGDLAERLLGHPQVLCVVSTRTAARKTFEALSEHNTSARHLSALMCPAHRTEELFAIRRALEAGELCRVVSTQLIEAGVDIDFPVVFRALAGIDSIAQAAGRCNREGKLPGLGQVFVYEPSRPQPRVFRRAVSAATEVLRLFPDNPMSLQAVEHYFRRVYWEADLDDRQLVARLNEGARGLDFPFREVAQEFRIIDNAMESVIIPWDGKARELMERLRRWEDVSSTARSLQRYTVQVYPHELVEMEREGAVERVHDTFTLLVTMRLYDPKLGLCPGGDTWEPEDLVI